MAYFIDGVPLNAVSSIHTPNYADLNILIPETVERLEVVRGPVSALYGDSSLGGSVNIVPKRFDSTGEVKGYGGYFNTGRGVMTYSQPRAIDLPFGGEDSPHRAGGQLYVEFIGKKSLTEDGVITTTPYQRLSSRVFYGHQSGWTGFVDMIWYPSNRLSETAINFGNPINATPGDIVVNPQAPYALMVGASYRFKTGG